MNGDEGEDGGGVLCQNNYRRKLKNQRKANQNNRTPSMASPMIWVGESLMGRMSLESQTGFSGFSISDGF